MRSVTLPTFRIANAHAITSQLWVGGDLDLDTMTADDQLRELIDAGLTHIIDARIEANDEDFVVEFGKASGIQVGYLHHGMDDAGQRVPAEWFETGVGFALEAIEAGGTVLTHCHMGINRGPSLGFAVLLAQDWDPIDALTAIRTARPIAYIDYAHDALAWHHKRSGSSRAERRASLRRVDKWRRDNHLDAAAVIRGIRTETERPR